MNKLIQKRRSQVKTQKIHSQVILQLQGVSWSNLNSQKSILHNRINIISHQSHLEMKSLLLIRFQMIISLR